MRVIAGRARGTVLFAPAGDYIRPTADRIKEDLFNIIAPYVVGARFLDLFAGTGQIGIEALSRGAENAVFVERERGAADLIRKNIAKCKLDAAGDVICGEVALTLQKLGNSGQAFDIVYLDPPYDMDELAGVAKALTEGGLLCDGSLVIAEQPSNAQNHDIPKLQAYKLKEYSTTKLTFMKYISK